MWNYSFNIDLSSPISLFLMSSLPLFSSAGISRCAFTYSQERVAIISQPARAFFSASLASLIRHMLVGSSTHWQQTKLKQLVPCFSASSPQASWVEPPEVRHSPLQSLLLFILCTTLRPLYLQPCSVCSVCQCYHQHDGLSCLRLVWTCNCSITLHCTDLRTQQSLEWKIQRDRGGGKGRDRKRAAPQQRGGIIVPAAEGSTCPTEEGGPPTWSIWLQGGTLRGR